MRSVRLPTAFCHSQPKVSKEMTIAAKSAASLSPTTPRLSDLVADPFVSLGFYFRTRVLQPLDMNRNRLFPFRFSKTGEGENPPAYPEHQNKGAREVEGDGG